LNKEEAVKLFHVVLIALVAVVLLAPIAEAQQFILQNPNGVPGAFYHPVWSAKTYAASQKDTSAAYNVCGVRDLEAYIIYNDSVNVITRFEYRSTTSAAWVWVAGDTLDQTGGGVVSTSTVHEKILRSSTVSAMNFGGQLRIIQVFQATLCGVTTPTYTVHWRYKP
jgi:hypothetical protein